MGHVQDQLMGFDLMDPPRYPSLREEGDWGVVTWNVLNHSQ